MTLGDYVLREPNNPWTDFKARMAVGTFITIFLLIISYGNIKYAEISENRWFRDMMNQTPFTDVVINDIHRTEYELIVSGTLMKVRDCQTFGPVIAQVVKDGVSFPAEFSLRENPNQVVSRPVMSVPQAFGPWLIISPVSWLDRAIMYRTHECADHVYQTNVVFDQE